MDEVTKKRLERLEEHVADLQRNVRDGDAFDDLEQRLKLLEDENIKMASLLSAMALILATAKLVGDPMEITRIAQSMEPGLVQAREEIRSGRDITDS